MKKIKLVLATVLISASACFSVLAGTWTNIDPEDGYEYSKPVFYLKDDGTYACNEWIVDNGETYWINSYGTLPYYGGIAPDGTWYDDDGKKVDFKGTYLDSSNVTKIRKEMTYEQVVNILGAPHSLDKMEGYEYFSNAYNYTNATWYSQDMYSYIKISFRDNKIYSIDFKAYFN